MGQGRAVQVEPMKSTLKAPGAQRLKLQYDESLSSFAFKFNLCRYNKAAREMARVRGRGLHLSTFQLNLSRF